MTITVSRRDSLTMLGALGLLTGCAAPTVRLNPDIAPISFDAAPLPLNVETIRLLIRPRLPVGGATVPVDADFVVPPEDIARLWAKQRLQAVGGNQDATYIIDDASATSRQTPEGEAVAALLQVRLLVADRDGTERGSAGARVESELRITGSPNIVERQEMLHRMSVEMAAELDKQMIASISRTLASFTGGTESG
jgi:hypothetical protein